MTKLLFPAATLARWNRGDSDMASLVEWAADDAWGALKRGWDVYDLGRGRSCPHSAADLRAAVITEIENSSPAGRDEDHDDFDALRDAALERLGYVVGVTAGYEAIVKGTR